MVDREHDHGKVSFARKGWREEEVKLSVSVPAGYAEWLKQEAFEMDMSVSALMRAAVIPGVQLVKTLHGMDRITIEDIRSDTARGVIRE